MCNDVEELLARERAERRRQIDRIWVELCNHSERVRAELEAREARMQSEAARESSQVFEWLLGAVLVLMVSFSLLFCGLSLFIEHRIRSAELANKAVHGLVTERRLPESTLKT
jgi:type VI protein secretion system component VasF